MKIRKIEFENDPILGNIVLDFTDSNGQTINTLIIAGENGAGKSALLNAIFELPNFGINTKQRNQKRSFELEMSEDEIQILKQTNALKNASTFQLEGNILYFSIDYNFINNWDQFSLSAKTIEGRPFKAHGSILADHNMIRFIKVIFSDVEINFTPRNIQTVTSSNIDRTDIQSEKSNANLATEITQLLIDIQTIDALDLSNWVKLNFGKAPPSDEIDVRMRRFTDAFEFMFPTKKYLRTDTTEQQKKLIFAEYGKEMGIENLSSGEKQIVFRGSFLLKNKQSSKGAVVLIDEPEISLHPNWQLKILKFFKTLFTDAKGEQASQLFIATHSPFILHNYDRHDDKVIILQKDDYGNVTVSSDPKYYSWSDEKIVQEAFKISHIVSTNKTTILVEGETDEKYLSKCVDIFNHQDKNIKFEWIGRLNEKGGAVNTGYAALDHAKDFFLANMEMLHNKLILLYDSDISRPSEDQGFLSVRCMSKNVDNKKFAKGIENLIVLKSSFGLKNFYSTNKKTDAYSGSVTRRELDKMKLCDFICTQISKDEQIKILKKVNDEILKLPFT